MITKKRIWLVLAILFCLSMGLWPARQIEAKTKNYHFYSCYAKTFKKSKGYIVIKTVPNTDHGYPMKTFSIKYKPSSKIKYTIYYVGGTAPARYTTFYEMKKDVNSAYKEYKRTGTYSSPADVIVKVKKNKITEIRFTYS